ncbi:TetR family transcriptional regulator [Pseudooceanicola spongiae]|uniref:TetR family transcriptional regulator n=2 Tax=Pseudooceanicola spongiae TaxID=2613965 RepID=A0A7L9WKZ8_9RHOB|nr:TetR family transcriptional regulator [Pseudooceanicola spongiae]
MVEDKMANWNGEVASREQIREQKRRAALRVASRLFNEKGYHATSLDQIADQIGVTKTALYYYFRNKEELLYDCLQVSFACGEQARAEAEAMDGTDYERFCHYYRRFTQLAIEQSGAFTTTANIRALPQNMQDALLARRDALHDYMQGLLDGAMDAGNLRRLNPRAATGYFFGSINWMLSWHLEGRGREAGEYDDAEDFSDLVLDQALHGLANRI